jgi:hypothetical protein
MKRCTYCGKEFPDDAKACAIDQQDLVPIPTKPELPLTRALGTTPAMDEAAARRQALKEKVFAIARDARAKCASFGEIEIELKKSEIDPEIIHEVMMEIEGRTPQALAGKQDMELKHGACWLFGGLFLTVITFSLARSSPGGGIYIVAYGPILFGGAQFIRALLKPK